jgi:hypothetical protein
MTAARSGSGCVGQVCREPNVAVVEPDHVRAGIREELAELVGPHQHLRGKADGGLNGEGPPSGGGDVARLVISPRTAEGHVEKILTKLGFNTRIQVVSWVVRQHAHRT